MQTVPDITAANVARLRAYRALTVRALSQRLGDLGYPILASGISKIENGERKVTVADLVALALALNVSPIRLLLPGADERDEARASLTPDGDAVAITEKCSATWEQVWQWASGDAPLDDCTPAELFRWLRLNRPHDDEAITAAWLAEVEQTPGWTVERDECGRITHTTGPNARPGGPPVRTAAPTSLPPLTLKPGAGVDR